MALLFLFGALREKHAASSLFACVGLHGALVVFRTIGFVLYHDFDAITYRLALGAWAIFLLGTVILYGRSRDGGGAG